ncbi:MAG: hypothetical protein VB877_20650 [Pirellulaceae bacterium]
MSSPAGNSITACIHELKAGAAAAAQQLWQRYCLRLTDFARKKLVPWRAAWQTKKTWH